MLPGCAELVAFMAVPVQRRKPAAVKTAANPS
jgi:hypothetical protein